MLKQRTTRVSKDAAVCNRHCTVTVAYACVPSQASGALRKGLMAWVCVCVHLPSCLFVSTCRAHRLPCHAHTRARVYRQTQTQTHIPNTQHPSPKKKRNAGANERCNILARQVWHHVCFFTGRERSSKSKSTPMSYVSQKSLNSGSYTKRVLA